MLGFGRRKKWRESEVNRDAAGRFAQKPMGSKEVRALKATAARAMDMEDRRGPRLRWGAAGVKGWWYIPKGGAVYWVRQESTPQMIRGYYYVPGKPWPVTPPRDTWHSWRSYNGVPGKTMLSGVVPDDVWRAAIIDRHGMRDNKESARTEAFTGRRSRAGVGEFGVKARGLKTTRPKKR